ncbi:helix-turn-helix domain-containing protein [Shewanella aestuarii]|uniref:Helix-turn-helix domain-containing protein n=1 Tax=Shewanella aestuarii TaxID=1028752 RepID=A0A6G9QMX6_9GAMM|nr:helix-turn-helix domain-containing protein [Shewanella aestuarii]QIR15425.1 helix-turn-helix domain-containing protein [Shewanella aestuarii]
MYKHKREFKLTVSKRHLSGESPIQLAKEFKIHPRLVKYWSQVYSIHQFEAFRDGHEYQTADAKFSALNLMWTNQWSISHTSAVLNLSSPGILYMWEKHYISDGINGLRSKTKGRPKMKLRSNSQAQKSDDQKSIEELKEELAYLRAENAVLKKLEELEQQKRQQTKKKR